MRREQEPSAVASALTTATRQRSTLSVDVKSSVCAVTMVIEGNRVIVVIPFLSLLLDVL